MIKPVIHKVYVCSININYFIYKMINFSKYSYLTFEQCVKENNELQRKLNREVDVEESKRMCRGMYILFFSI